LVDAGKHELVANGMNEAEALASSATSSYWILIPCYAIILYFALSGHKLGMKKNQNK